MPSILKLSVAIIGVFSAIVSAIPQLNENSKICPFNGTLGPNVLLAVVKLPDNSTEINAWVYGYNWCSHSNKVSGGTDICTTDHVDRAVEFMHIPYTNKFGTMHWDCYGNMNITFSGCQSLGEGKTDYSKVEATMKSQDGLTEYKYQCVDDREHHACVYNGQLSPPSEASYTAFMSCGITAEP